MRIVPVTGCLWLPFEVDAIKDRPEIRGVDATAEDVNLAEAIQGAVQDFEDYTGRILCRSTWDLFLDAFPDAGDVIETPGPLISVESIQYYDSANSLMSLSVSDYYVAIGDLLVGKIGMSTAAVSWPDTYARADAVVIRFVAGYPNPNSIPRMIKDGLLLKIQEVMDGVDRSQAYQRKWTLRRMCIA
jgi:uncharacterized phiE125 gp8 family phage protein